MKEQLIKRLHAFLRAVKPEAFIGQVTSLNELLADQVKETGLSVDLASTEPYWYLPPDSPKAGQIRLIAKYSARDKKGSNE